MTFVIELDDCSEEIYEFFERSTQVSHIERLTENSLLVTKTSCGAYEAVDRNHGIMRRRNQISSTRRVYTVLLFRREDLKAVIEEFKAIGVATLGNVKEFGAPASRLTARQRQVLELALERGYFEWPRALTSEELAAELGCQPLDSPGASPEGTGETPLGCPRGDDGRVGVPRLRPADHGRQPLGDVRVRSWTTVSRAFD